MLHYARHEHADGSDDEMIKTKRGSMSKIKKGESKLDYEKRRRAEANKRYRDRQRKLK